MAKNNHGEIIDVVNKVMARIPGLDMKDSLWMQQTLDEGVKELVRKSSIGKEALSEFLFQKPPPFNKEAEASFLGKVMLFPPKAMPSCNLITREYFYDQRHVWLWTAISSLWEEGKKITMDGIISSLTTYDKLDKAGGKRYIEALVKDQSTIEDLSDRISEITNYYVLRGVWEECVKAVHAVYSVEPKGVDDFRHGVIEKLAKYSENNIRSYQDGASLAEKLKERRTIQEDAALRGDGVTGHASPFEDLDATTGGWQDTDMIVIAARPGMSKTGLLISDVIRAIQLGEPVAVFSLEMSDIQLAMRLFCGMKTYQMKDLLRKDGIGKLANDAFDKFVNDELPNYNIFIDDKPGVNWRYIQDRSLYFKNKYGIRRIYVDYIQLMGGVDPRVSSSEQIVSENSRGLKIVAKSCGCPIMVLSQLSRKCEERPNHRPLLSDLRQSGSIEQDADIVIFIYRDEYYDIFTDDDGNSTEGIGELIIAKHRNGPLGTIKVFFNAPYIKWGNLRERPAGYTLRPNSGDDDDFFNDEAAKRAVDAIF